MTTMTSSASALHGALSPLLARLGLTLLHTIWEGMLLAAILWVALGILRGRSPQARYLAGCGAALAMMALMVLTFLLVPVSGTFTPSRSEEGGRNGAVPSAVPAAPFSVASSDADDLRVPNASHPRSPAVGILYLTQIWPLLAAWCQRGAKLLPSLALAWAAGVLALAIRLIVGCAGVRQLRDHGTSPVEPSWQQRLLALARRMRIDQPVSLRQSTCVTTPAVIGWLRPVILLPVGMCAGLSTAQVEMILAHELAHIGRQDYLVNLLLNVVETVFFYHPAVWWIATRVREERENACDDLALAVGNDDRLGYARALASLEEMRLPFQTLALAARGESGTLLTRLRRLLGVSTTREPAFPPRKTACGLAGTAVLSGAVAAFLVVVGLVPAQSQDAASAAVRPARGAPSLANQFAGLPESAREQVVTHVKVTDEKGGPVAGAEVLIRGIRPARSGDYFGWEHGVGALTDAQGDAAVTYPRYIEEKRTTGTLCLAVKHPDYCDQQADWRVDGRGPASKPVPLVRGAIIRVCGHLPEPESGDAHPVIYPELAADQVVDLSMLNWHKLGDNEWENRKVAPGNYYLRADHANADGTTSFSRPQQIAAVGSETYAFDLELQRGERLEGRLDDSVPRPVVHGRVVAHLYAAAPGKGAKHLNWNTWREIAPDGTFVFESLPAGTVEMTAQCAGFASANPPKGNRFDDEVTLPQSFVAAPGAKNTAAIKMEPTATVAVEVRNEAGQPVSGAQVHFFPNVKFTPGFTTGFNESLGRDEDAVAAGPNVEPPKDELASATLKAFQTRTDGAGSAEIRDLPAGKQSLYLTDENYELPAVMVHDQGRRLVTVKLEPGEKKHVVVQVQKKGTDPLMDSPPASTPAASPEPGQMATPAPSPATPTIPTSPTALQDAWNEFTKVDAEATRFDQTQQQMKPAGDEQARQKSMAGFAALQDKYHDACAQFVRLAPKEDSRRPLVLLLATGSDKKATPAERTAVVDEILATPTAPAEVQVRALLLRESTAATATKIIEFLASHPQEPRRRELESKVARIRANDPSSEPPAADLPSGVDPSPGPKNAAENPSPSGSANFIWTSEEQSVPASTIAATDEKRALLDLYKRRGYAFPESFIDERIATIVHQDFGDNRAAFLKDIQAKGYTEASFRSTEREWVIVQAMRQRLESEAREAKAQAIILPRVQVLDWRLADAIELLATEVRRLNPQVRGMSIRLDPQATQAFKDAKVTLDLSNVSLLEVLRVLARQTHGRFALDRQGMGIVAQAPE